MINFYVVANYISYYGPTISETGLTHRYDRRASKLFLVFGCCKFSKYLIKAFSVLAINVIKADGLCKIRLVDNAYDAQMGITYVPIWYMARAR